MRDFLASRRPSPAMAVAFVALLAALSGTAIALPGKNTIDKNDFKKGAVRTKALAKNAVTGAKIKNGAVGTRDVRNDSVTGTDINESTLGEVPSANSANTASSANSANTADTAASAENAEQLDNLDSADFLRSDSFGVALAGANVASDGSVNAWFNRFGGEPTVVRNSAGNYGLTFPGLEGQLFNSEVIHMATLFSSTGEIRASSGGGNPLVLTHDSAGTAADRSFYYTVFGTNVAP
jgi:hypothetical protein